MHNYFQRSVEYPQHISVGGIVVNDKKEVCVHFFTKEQLQKSMEAKGVTPRDIILLMRETINPNETLEQGLHRGLEEEFGITAELTTYAGSITCEIIEGGFSFQKTTLYFLCKFMNQDESKREKGIEGQSKILWLPIDEAIQIMKEQRKDTGKCEADESSMLERVKHLI